MVSEGEVRSCELPKIAVASRLGVHLFEVPFCSVFLRTSLTAYLSIDRGQYESSAIRLGARADSFYEYLLFVNSTLREVRQAHILQQKAIPSNGTPSQPYFRPFLIEYTE